MNLDQSADLTIDLLRRPQVYHHHSRNVRLLGPSYNMLRLAPQVSTTSVICCLSPVYADALIAAFEHAPITSDEVREQTAQLATQALSPTSSRLQPPHHDVTPSSPDYLFNPTKLSRPRPSIDSMPSSDVGDERRDSSQEPTGGVDDNDAAFRRSVHKKERSTSSTSELDMSEAASRNIKSEQRPESSSVDESTPLLKRRSPQYEDLEESPWRTSSETFHIPKKKENTFHRLAHIGRVKVARTVNTALSPKSWSARAVWKNSVKLPVSLLPCVLLGLLLNVLDALSYGG